MYGDTRQNPEHLSLITGFEVISVIVVLNMLIATMSNTFQKVNDNVDIEWTFGKTEVSSHYSSTYYLLHNSTSVLPQTLQLQNFTVFCDSIVGTYFAFHLF